MKLDDLFIQDPPRLGNTWRGDVLFRDLLAGYLPLETLSAIESQLDALGELAGGALYELQLLDLPNEPKLTQYDAWGRRIDRIELTAVWQRARRVAAEFGILAAGYDERYGADARLHEFALAYLFLPSTDIYGCPLAMSDGALAVLRHTGNQMLRRRAEPRLMSRDPEACWTSGQWMTETTGGSDVGGTETVARQDAQGLWRLYGRKWFTSAATSEMALTLARPEGAPAGSAGLALFYLEPHDRAGRLNHIEILRLKDKLGTRKLPTAELWLDGVPAEPVAGLDRGVPNIAPMLTLTRTWNAVTAAALLARGVLLAADYAPRRSAFGAPLAALPLHRATLGALHARCAATLHLAFTQVALLGRAEHGTSGEAVLRLVTPIAKLATARDAVAGLSEVVESFGGAGYLEDTGLPQLLRDAQVLTIWEGTTNVLALDLLRALGQVGGLKVLHDWLAERLARIPAKPEWCGRLSAAATAWQQWFDAEHDAGRQSGARHLALAQARMIQAVALLEQAAATPARAGFYRAVAERLARHLEPDDRLDEIPVLDSAAGGPAAQ